MMAIERDLCSVNGEGLCFLLALVIARSSAVEETRECGCEVSRPREGLSVVVGVWTLALSFNDLLSGGLGGRTLRCAQSSLVSNVDIMFVLG